MQTNVKFDQFVDMVRKCKRAIVTSHFNPDGDAIGSALALTGILRKAGIEALTIVPNDYPDFLKWIPGNDQVLVYNNQSEIAKEQIQKADLIFCLDYNALHRIDKMEPPVRASSAVKILIDHHLEPVFSDFDYYYSKIQVSSTSELLFQFIERCGWKSLVDADIASALFVGIMTDTGSFSFACNYPETFQAAAFLVGTGIDAEHIHRLVYDTYSEDRLRLLGYCLSNKLTILPEFNTAFIALSRSELDQFHHKTGDTEGIVNYALSIENIKLAVLLTEKADRVRLSFRSKGNLAVNTIARTHFAGGGHRNAAGGDSFESLERTIQTLKRILLQYKDEIHRSTS